MIGKTANSILMNEARQSLSGKWGLAVGTFAIAIFLLGSGSVIPLAGPLLIGGPLALGMATFSLNLARNKHAKFGQLFKGFENFGTSLIAYLLTMLFVFLGTLCFIIPGIIIAFMLSQIYYIIADNPTIRPMDALRKSRDMMEGNKSKLFELYLRFFGLSLLCLLTLGIGFLWLLPYMQVSLAKFHDDINGQKGLNTNEMNSPITLDNLSILDPQRAADSELRNRRYE